MRLGKYAFVHPVFMAPMAGITDKAFREVITSIGGQYVCTEMISDNALIHKNPKTFQMLNLEGEQEPRIVQIFGSEPDTMAQAATIAVEHGANIIDINMGCPTPKIVKNGEGAALLQNLPLAEKIASSVVGSVNVPVTVKIRLGWDSTHIVALELASRLENAGIEMLTLHARTREQYYSGRANWNWIKEIKQKTRIPVIGNGDILTPQDALDMIQTTGCDGVMIARGALGNPWLINRTQHFLKTGELLAEPQSSERLQISLAHFEKLLIYKGEQIGVNEMRKHAAWYIKGLRNATEYRSDIMKIKEPKDMRIVLTKIFESCLM